MDNTKKRDLIFLAIFSAAFAFVEFMIVYYIRKLYYPGDVLFPLNVNMPAEIFCLEIAREFCTILMLACVAFIAAKTIKEKFAYFIFGFAIWDIFYYIWLKLVLDWPSYFMEWDVLFLIPIPWVSPWFVPVIISLALTALSIVLLSYPKEKVKPKEWTAILLSGIIFIVSFILDYAKIMFKNYGSKQDIVLAISKYTPSNYNWWLFAFGIVLLAYSIYSFMKRAKK